MSAKRATSAPSSSRSGSRIVTCMPTTRPEPSRPPSSASRSSKPMPSRLRRVDGRHERAVDDVGVDVQPDAVEPAPGQRGDRVGGDGRGAALAHVAAGVDGDRLAQLRDLVGTPRGRRCARRPPPSTSGRRPSRSASGPPRPVTSATSCAGGRQGVAVGVARVREVVVAVDVEEAVAAAAGERQRGAEQDAAVAAEHEREGAGVEQRADPVGEPQRVAHLRGLVAHGLAGQRRRQVARRRDHAGVDGVEAPQQARVAQRAGELVDAGRHALGGRAQAEVGGRVERGDAMGEVRDLVRGHEP